MDESQAQIISFKGEEAKEALLEYAKKKGQAIPEYGAFEIRTAGGQVHIFLFGPSLKGIGSMTPQGNA